MRLRKVDVNLVQAGATEWVWSRLGDALVRGLDCAVMTTPAPVVGAGQYVFFSPEFAYMATPEQTRRSTVILNHFEAPPRDLATREDVLRAAPRVVVLCEGARSVLRKAKIPSTVIHYGIDTDTFHPGLRSLNLSDFVVGVCGKNHETGRKAPERILEIASMMPIGTRFLFCGPGWGALINAIAEHTKCSAEAWLPWRNYSRHPEYYAQLDALLVASHVEGGPYPVLEALACEVPVVSTPVGWVPELADSPGVVIYRHGDAASAAGLLGRIRAFAGTPGQAIRIGVLGWTWEKACRQWGQLLGVKVRQQPKGDARPCLRLIETKRASCA